MNDNLIVIDWLSISGRFPSLDSMFDFLGISNSYIAGQFQGCYRKFFDYGLSYSSEGKQAITLLYGQSTNTNQSVESPETIGFIDLSGRGCRLFESYSDISFYELIKEVYELDGFSISRIDIALDIKDKDYPMSRFVNAYRTENYICSARSTSLIESKNNEIKGYSLYFGKRASDVRINIYDKRAERGFTERVLPEGWIRIEVRLRHQTAMAFLERFVNGEPLSKLYFGILNAKLRFLSPSKTDSNKTRWKSARFWQQLIKDNEKLVLEFPGATYDLSKWEYNFWLQCGSRLKLMMQLVPNPWDLYREINNRKIELNQSQRFLIDNYIPGTIWYELCS